MITLITGMPGTGKTAALVSLLQGLVEKKRPIVLDVLQDGEDKGKACIPDLALPYTLIEDARTWHQPGVVEDGTAIVFDEVQRIWRPAGSSAAVPPDIAALETHRHRGLDFFIITQHPNLVHSNVRRLVGRHIHLRDNGVLGRWWYEWPEATNPETYRSCPNKRRYKLPKSALGTYKSASIHVKPIRTIPRAVTVLALCVVLLGFAAWRVYSVVKAKTTPTPDPSAAAAATPAAPRPAADLVNRQGKRLAVLGVGEPVKNREPYAGIGVHLAGVYQVNGATRSFFTLSVDGRVVGTVSDKELQRAGYGWRSTGAPCSIVLIFNEQERFVTCDAPVVAPTPQQRQVISDPGQPTVPPTPARPVA